LPSKPVEEQCRATLAVPVSGDNEEVVNVHNIAQSGTLTGRRGPGG
jgi:hypothetical protein